MGSLKSTICAGFVFCICGLAQSSPATNTQLVVQVRSEAALSWQSNSVVMVKARLEPRTQAKVWADDSCGSPLADAYVIAASGTYTIPLAAIDGSGKANICLSSGAGSLSTNLPELRK
jgi:hypothetical protein